jgi:hypothetical protein
MGGCEKSLAEGYVRDGFGHSIGSLDSLGFADLGSPSILSTPPLSENLRDFPLLWSLFRTEKCFTLFLETLQRGYSFGGQAQPAPAAFQSVADRPVLRPESFRGGCSFGAGPTSVRSLPAVVAARRQGRARRDATPIPATSV